MEHDEQADRLEGEADKMEEQGERVSARIEEAVDDWESKQQDAAVPGAQPEPDQEQPDAGEDEQATGNPDAAGRSDTEEPG